VGHEYDAPSPFNNIVQGAEGAIDSVGVTNDSVLNHIVINTHQYDFVGEICMLNDGKLVLLGFHRHVDVLS
jgi:hypothetical protein